MAALADFLHYPPRGEETVCHTAELSVDTEPLSLSLKLELHVGSTQLS